MCPNPYKISEGQIEESLVKNLTYLKKILNLELEIKLIGRQLRLKFGEKRIDLLILHGKNLYLIELKVTRFSKAQIQQVNEYQEELLNLQSKDELIKGDIIACLLVTNASEIDKKYALDNQVNLIVYNPLEVLESYYKNLSINASFLKVKPNDYGVYNIGLIHRVLIELSQEVFHEEDIVNRVGLSKNSVHNHLKVAKEFALVKEKNNVLFLTDLGEEYIKSCNEGILVNKLSQKKIDILKKLIAKDPFYSSTVFGIYCIVESALILSRNECPIHLNDLKNMFQKIGGKSSEWQAEKSLDTATRTFLNFAIDLDLLGKIEQLIVITPAGFRFILMLQLHKSIDMIETLNQWS